MTKVYACLVGKWVCLNDDENCTIDQGYSPSVWYKEGGQVYAPFERKYENRFEELNYVRIFYKNKTYRINPIFVQIVNE